MKRFQMLVAAMLILQAASFPVHAGPIGITGSTTVMPIAKKIADAFMAEHRDVRIEISGGGSGNGIKAIIDGNTDIGNSSRFIKDKERQYATGKGVYPVPFRVAYDCIVPVVHPSNRLTNIGIEELRLIYTGEIGNWNKLGGDDKPITVVSRDTASGTYEVWESKVMNGAPVHPGARLVDGNADVVRAVALNPDAIGYIGLGYLTDRVRALRVENIKGSQKTTIDGTYPISRPLFMFTRGWPEGDTLKFINYVLEPGLGQARVAEAGFIPVYETGGNKSVVAHTETASPGAVETGQANRPESISEIRKIQTFLNALGYNAGPVDGIKGTQTVTAITAFQRQNGIPVDPAVSAGLIDRLSEARGKSGK